MSTTSKPAIDADLMANIEAMRAKLRNGGVEEFKEPVAPTVTAALKNAEEGEHKYSVLWGVKKPPKTLPDFAVRLRDITTLPESVHELIPEVEATYVAQGMNEYMFTKAMVENQRVLLSGPKGSGKSTLPKQWCALTGTPFFRVQARRTTEAEDLFGNISVRNGNVVFNDGPVTLAARIGGLVCIDEVSLLQAGAAMGLQWLIEPNGKISLPDFPSDNPKDKTVTPHPDFRIVFTDNTTLAGDHTGQYVGTNVQNAAFRDRIDTFIRVQYMPPAQEASMIKNHVPGIPDDVLKSMVRIATDVRAGHEKGDCECTMSPRVLLRWAKDTVAFGDVGFSFRFNFMNSLSPDDEQIIDALYKKVFGSSVPTT